MRINRLGCGLLAGVVLAAGIRLGSAAGPPALAWDAMSKEAKPARGVWDVPFTFYATNMSKQEIVLNSLRTSCGCTLAKLPAEPYRLAPGKAVPIAVTLDLRGRAGLMFKTVTVDTSAGEQVLWTKVEIPPPPPGKPVGVLEPDRAQNLRLAQADRQAVFKGDCRRCHVKPGEGKLGKPLYDAVCGICHDAEHRNAVVPDLRQPRSVRDIQFWDDWINHGKPGTLMPAFSQKEGGPLTRDEINSLTVYLHEMFPKVPRPAPKR